MRFAYATNALHQTGNRLNLSTSNICDEQERAGGLCPDRPVARKETRTMNDNTQLRQRLIEAFNTASEAHGFAFVQVNGADDDWAYWYASVLQQPLSLILNRELTRSQIVVCLTAIEEERLSRFGDQHPWAPLYADHFLIMFAAPQPDTQPELALYYYPECPYCQRVLRTIAETGTGVSLRHIWDAPQHRADLQAARGRTTVPVLRITDKDGDRWMPESADIVRYLHELART